MNMALTPAEDGLDHTASRQKDVVADDPQQSQEAMIA